MVPIVMLTKDILQLVLVILPETMVIMVEHMEAMKDGMVTKAGIIIHQMEDITLITDLLITVIIISHIMVLIITQIIIIIRQQYTIINPITTNMITEYNTMSQAFQ